MVEYPYRTFENGLSNPKINVPFSALKARKVFKPPYKAVVDGQIVVVNEEKEWQAQMAPFWDECLQEADALALYLTHDEQAIGDSQHEHVPPFHESIWRPLSQMEVMERLMALGYEVNLPEDGKRFSGKVKIGFYESSNTTTQTRGSIFGGCVRTGEEKFPEIGQILGISPNVAKRQNDKWLESLNAKYKAQTDLFGGGT